MGGIMFNVIKGCTGFKRMPHIIILETPNCIPLIPICGREEGFIWSSQRKDAKAQLPTEREHPSFSPPKVWALCTGTESRGMAPISFFGNFLHLPLPFSNTHSLFLPPDLLDTYEEEGTLDIDGAWGEGSVPSLYAHWHGDICFILEELPSASGNCIWWGKRVALDLDRPGFEFMLWSNFSCFLNPFFHGQDRSSNHAHLIRQLWGFTVMTHFKHLSQGLVCN